MTEPSLEVKMRYAVLHDKGWAYTPTAVINVYGDWLIGIHGYQFLKIDISDVMENPEPQEIVAFEKLLASIMNALMLSMGDIEEIEDKIGECIRDYEKENNREVSFQFSKSRGVIF